ncbi:Small subunit (SSU) processome component [Pichia californica]|uniref:U3 small nucleolar ribonucleoprotein protein IMP3 n=1 Tax=Pichia californica TaxID=460514 RepID=A0A9P7BGS8_9ASCO|nr:Small subunit (SSU) processome component [[Candida] californica]KAG0690436.1 Small subunit (SSU) processome component [[Candida] californica]
MVRKLKYHEQKLLKKVDLYNYKQDNNHRESDIIQRYQLSNRNDYHSYNKIIGKLKQVTRKLALLEANDPFRIKHEQLLLEKLYNLGLLPTTSKISSIENKLSVSSLCRRRIGVMMVKFRMAQNISDANKFIRQGHIRVGNKVITDPAYLITRNLEDYLTWVDDSKIKKNVMTFKNKWDDYSVDN